MKKIYLAVFILCFFTRGGSAQPALSPEVLVDVSEQKLYLYRGGKVLKAYPVSTSKYGIGNLEGSEKTPLGWHQVAKKIGDGAPLNTIFKNRVNTGRVFTGYANAHREDFITSRILWLEGLEPGINKGKRIDSFKRYIYIHGTADEDLIGQPASHGCVRMRNTDVVEIFDLLQVRSRVLIRF